MTSSIKLHERLERTVNSDLLNWQVLEYNGIIRDISNPHSTGMSGFKVKYNIVPKNGHILITFWVEIFPKNGAKSEKVSENPGKTPQDIVKDMISGPNSRAFGKSWIRDYFSAPANTRNIHVNSFPSCAGLADSVIKIDNRPKKEPLVINVLGQSFEIGGDE